MVTTILKQCNDLTLSEIDGLVYDLQDLYKEKFDSQFKTVRIYPGSRIEEKIKSETGYHCYHENSSGSSGRGTHVIVIPIAKYTEELKKELIEKYDDKW